MIRIDLGQQHPGQLVGLQKDVQTCHRLVQRQAGIEVWEVSQRQFGCVDDVSDLPCLECTQRKRFLLFALVSEQDDPIIVQQRLSWPDVSERRSRLADDVGDSHVVEDAAARGGGCIEIDITVK